MSSAMRSRSNPNRCASASSPINASSVTRAGCPSSIRARSRIRRIVSARRSSAWPLEPFDRQIAQLFDLVEPPARFGDVRERHANLGKLRRRRRIPRRHVQIRARGARARTRARRAFAAACAQRYASAASPAASKCSAISPGPMRRVPLERLRDALVQLPRPVARNATRRARRRSRRGRRHTRPASVRTSDEASPRSPLLRSPDEPLARCPRLHRRAAPRRTPVR